jgi:hypothetical protein
MKNLMGKLKGIINSFNNKFHNKKGIANFFKNYLTPTILGICIISLVLLVQFSPIFSILWLSVVSLYFLYIRSYKDISKIWGFTLVMWYLIFTTSLSEITILIGFDNTKVIINYLLDNNFLFENLCFQTVYILDALSAKLGFSIYIPAVINIFSFLAKLFDNKKSGCSEEPKKASWFSSSDKAEKSQSEEEMSKCETLARDLEKCRSMFHSSNSTTDGNRTVTYSKTWVPGFGKINSCHARNATNLEKTLYEDKKAEKK